MPLFETKRVELPGDKDEWVDIRELSVDELQEADAIGTESATKLMSMLPATLVETQLEKGRNDPTEQVVRYEGFDPATLLKYGLTGWSFEEPFNDENRGKLSAKHGDVIARAIFELSVIPSGEVKASSLKPAEAGSSDVSVPLTSSTEPEAPSA